MALAVLPPNPDQGLFVTIGETINRGSIVGRNTWDDKPPGAYYLDAAVLRFAPNYAETCTLPTGTLVRVDHQVPRAQLVLSAFDTVYALALAAVVGWIAGRLFGHLAGALAALLCAVFSGMLQLLNGSGNPDFFALLPSTLSYAAAVRYAESKRLQWLVAAGAFGGGSILFKQTGAVLLVGIGVWLVAFSHPAIRRACAALFAGATAPLAIAAALLGSAGALAEVVDQTIVFNWFYVARPANT